MKGYNIDVGYIGYVPSEGKYQLFDNEGDCKQYILENE